MMHLSRLAEDWILYSSEEFGWLELGDGVTSGSSLMPQKKNPDSLELIRGKIGRVFGGLTSLLTTMKGLPHTYNRDMQEDKEPLFDSARTVKDCLTGANLLLRGMAVNEERMRAACDDGFLTATDLADYLAKKGVPFRKAHEITGKIVRHCEERGARLKDLSLKDLRAFSKAIGEDVRSAISLTNSVRLRKTRGGTGAEAVRARLSSLRTNDGARSRGARAGRPVDDDRLRGVRAQGDARAAQERRQHPSGRGESLSRNKVCRYGCRVAGGKARGGRIS